MGHRKQGFYALMNALRLVTKHIMTVNVGPIDTPFHQKPIHHMLKDGEKFGLMLISLQKISFMALKQNNWKLIA